ncbi:MAG: hypothetical protein IJZ38_12740 [Bacteroides sp.]|nr:hypothetical protein [Bacteroides sp.]
MNWTKFQTYGMAPDKAFEVLCNQLFENWCKENYPTDIASFSVVNGAGGDGGVESYATLTDGTLIALQAKWFPDSLTSSHIGQIRNSIKTALKLRPQICKYLVCIPRDLASITARSENSEDKRWNSFVDEIAKDYPAVAVELWNETRLVTELQKPSSSGILRFWFENAEITESCVEYAFRKAKSTWLNTRYVPEINTFGNIEKTVSLFLGAFDHRAVMVEDFSRICELCIRYREAADALIGICSDDPKLKEIISTTNNRLHAIYEASKAMGDCLAQEQLCDVSIDAAIFYVDFDSIIELIRRSHGAFRHHFHTSEVTKNLGKLSRFDYNKLVRDYNAGRDKRSILFLGDPGTGKTQGIGAVSEKLLSEGFHIPLLIQARGTPISHTWKDIISNYLGLSSAWSEEDLWQALSSMANRHKFTSEYLGSKCNILPKVIIFVDGLDESSPQERWVERIQETDVIVSRYPQIRFCFTARPTAMPKPFRYARIKRLSSSGDVPSHQLFDSYMNAYNITVQNRGWLKTALSTPLALKLFCELNQNSTFTCSEKAEISMAALWRKKIEKIEKEYSEIASVSLRNQYVLKAIVHLSEVFVGNATLERSCLIKGIADGLSLSPDQAEKLLVCLENYGVLSSFCETGTGILPDIYNYYPGIQGYFDFAEASILLQRYKHPQNIDFNLFPSLHHDTMSGLAILSIQNYDYLITRNQTLASTMEGGMEELQFLALQHTNHTNALPFVERTREIMSQNADGLIAIANRLVLPLARDLNHPLGVDLLDQFLSSFDKPAQRDILWSVPGYLKDGFGKRWYQGEGFELENEDYLLTIDDVCDGYPTIYAWALSSVDNSLRKLYRNRLMTWARLAPTEFYKLFLKFSNVNDPQILSDLFSIMMCLVYDGAGTELVRSVSSWITKNILHPDRIDNNRNVSIRYYAIAILHKAIQMGLLSNDEAVDFLPPYRANGNTISLNKDALQGTRMGGYSAIDYDLARYVLVDHFASDFVSYSSKEKGQFNRLIQSVASEQPEYSNISVDQFIISMAYAFILNMGWNESEFYDLSHDPAGKGIIGGVDISICRTHMPSTHGSMSPFMTVCEKYVWQARNELCGFLCDRLRYGDEEIEVTDYGMLDDFVIPTQELSQINPDDIPEDRPWHIPEPEQAILEGNNGCKEDVIESAFNAPVFNWEKWILVDNSDGRYKIEHNAPIALNMYSCFFGSAGVETNMFINAVLVDTKHVSAFIRDLEADAEEWDGVANPTDWYGGTNASCYITPKEICWFSWKTRYESSNANRYEQYAVLSAVDECCYNSPEYGDINYKLVSTPIRGMLGIIDSDGYLHWDHSRKIVAEYAIAGEKWRTCQSYLLANKDLLFSQLEHHHKTLVWIMRERRSHSGLATERHGEFGVDRIKSFVGFFEESQFVVKEIRSDVSSYIPIKKSFAK